MLTEISQRKTKNVCCHLSGKQKKPIDIANKLVVTSVIPVG